MMTSQQPVGLAGAGPQAGSPQLLVAPRAHGLAFLPSGADSGVEASQQWQADRMTDGSYVVVYVPGGQCLGTAAAPDGADQAELQSCNLQLGQRWTHPYLGKDSLGRDYWQLRSMADGRCLSAAGSWAAGTAAALRPCGTSLPWQQLIAFWSAY
jgi:hypothetical protein